MEFYVKELKKVVKGNELIVRKRLSNFLQKILIFLGYDNNHYRYKKVVYAEDSFQTSMEEKIKQYYDGMMYLIYNKNTHVTCSMLKRFFYLILGKELETNIIEEIKNKHFRLKEKAVLEKAVEFHLFVYEVLEVLSLEERFLISMMMLNYMLISNGIPGIQLLSGDLNEYVRLKEISCEGNYKEMVLFLIKIIRKQKFQSKDYYDNLEYLDLGIIYARLNMLKQEIKSMYQVKNLSIYGSYAKGENRYDSDIDILVSISKDLTYDEKEKNIEDLSKYLYVKFKRFIDIHDIERQIVWL